MSVALEQDNRFLAAFDDWRMNGGVRPPAWLADVREAAVARFAELGFPTLRDEDWRFTDVEAIARGRFVHAPSSADVTPDDLRPYLWNGESACHLVFVNGRYVAALSNADGLPPGVIAGSLADALQAPARGDHWIQDHLARYAGYERHPFVALSTAFITDGALLYVPRGCALDRPVHLLYVTAANGEPLATHPRNLLIAEQGSRLSVTETYATLDGGVHFTNPVTELVAGPGAVVDHGRLEREGPDALHVGTLQIHQRRDSDVRSHCLTFGGALVRHELNVVLAGEGANCLLNGLYVVGGRQHVDNHLRVEHAAPHGTSRENFKGILGERSRAVFTGRIVVRAGAQKTDGKQSNRNLLLSDGAKVNTRPQLEIFADDVKCTHGATVGQLDREALFYLRSRGLTAAEARSLLVHAFARESLEQVGIEPLRRQLHALLAERLAAAHALEAPP